MQISSVVESLLSDGEERFERICQILRDRVSLLVDQPWTVPSESVFAKDFGISRTPIKRIFNKLEYMGLVRIKNGVGTIVTDIYLYTFKETYDLRK